VNVISQSSTFGSTVYAFSEINLCSQSIYVFSQKHSCFVRFIYVD